MVSEKTIRELAFSKKSKISDAELFTSSALRQYLQDLVDIVIKKEVKNYNKIHDIPYSRTTDIRATVDYNPMKSAVAYAESSKKRGSLKDRIRIFINIGNMMFEKVKRREDRFFYLKGLLAHECSHVIFTDFRVNKKVEDTLLKEGKLYPEPKKEGEEFQNSYDDMLEFLQDKKNRKIFHSVLAHIMNIAEDGYIESAFMENNRGSLAEGLYELRWFDYQEMPTVGNLTEKISLPDTDPEKINVFGGISQLYLCYAKYKEVKYDNPDELDSEVYKAFEICMPDIDKSRSCKNPEKRYMYVMNTVVLLWPYIKKYLEDAINQKKQNGKGDENSSSGGSGDGDYEEIAKKILEELSDLVGGSEIENNLDTPGMHSDEDDDSEDETGAGEEGNESEVSKGEDDSETESLENSDGEDDSSEEESDAGESEDSKGEEPDEADADGDPDDDGKDPDYETEENNRYDHEDADYDSASEILDDILSGIARDMAETDLEKKRTEELNQKAAEIDKDDVHAGIRIKVNRMPVVSSDLYDEYSKIAPPLIKISKALQRRVSQQLKDRRRGGKESNLYFGRKLEARSLIRNDGRCFYRNKLPNMEPKICIAVLLDESGSMISLNRWAYARATALIIYDFCKSLDIPVMVYGHTADKEYQTVSMFSYAEFDSIDNKDRYRIMDIRPRSNNRDGLALSYMYDMLNKRPEEIKLLFVLSDGKPAAHPCYFGEAAKRDMQKTISRSKQKKIATIAAAIGSDKKEIEAIYGKESFLDVTDLETLPVILTNHIIKELKL